MEISIVCGFRRLQSKHSSSQFIVQRRTCCRRRRKYWIETPTFMLIFSPFTLHRLYIIFFQIKSLYKCVIIECYVLHRSVSYWQSLSRNFFLYSLRKHKWIETQIWKRDFNHVFSTTSATSLSLPTALWRRMLWLWPMKITNDAYFQSCQLMFRCLTEHFTILNIWKCFSHDL